MRLLFPPMQPVEAPARVFRFGVFEADTAQNSLTRKGIRVKVQDQPFRVLLLLLDRPGEIVSREELRQKLWPEGIYVDFDGSLNAILKKLRSALDDDSENPRFIETVPRKGYRFIAPVSATSLVRDTKSSDIPVIPPASEPAAVTVPGKSAAAETDSPVLSNSPKFEAHFLLYGLAGIVLMATASWFGFRYKSHAATTSQGTLSAPVAMRKSVAVLGFHNVSGQVNDAWLATAFSEMLSTELAAGEKLRLVSGEDVANLRLASPWSQTDSLDQLTTSRIATGLNADLLVLGSYTTVGRLERGQVRLDVRLQDAKTGEILSEIAETGSTGDLFQIATRAGEKLRDRLGIPRLDEPAEAGIIAALPRDGDAARLYALGLTKLRQFDYASAKELLQQAAVADPKFCFVHLMLAKAWAGLGYEEKRKEEVKRAVDLSSDLPRAQQLQVQGEYYESVADHEKAASTYRVLFELFPDSVENGFLLAASQFAAGHERQATETVSRLRQLPPPASDDPRIDLIEANVASNNTPAHLKLIRNAEQKAQLQGKNLIYAEARKDECLNLNYSEHPDQASAACEQAYNIYLAAGNRLLAADTLRMMGDTQGTLGQMAGAISMYERALHLLEGMGEHHKTGAILNNMAIAYANQGKLDRAEQLYRQAKYHFEAGGDKGNTATALGNIADIQFLRGDLASADRLYQQALEVENSLDRPDTLYLLYRRSDLALTQGRVREAHDLAQEAVESGRGRQGAYQYVTGAMLSLAQALRAEGDLTGARHELQDALEIQRKAGENYLVAGTQAALADLDLEEGHPEQAETILRSSIAEFEKEHEDPDAISAYTLLSRALLIEQKPDDARKAIQHAIELSRASSDPALKIPASIQSARVDLATSNASAATSAGQQLRSAISTAKRLGYYDLECEARLALAELELKNNSALARTQLSALSSEARNHGMKLMAQHAERTAEGSSALALK